MAKALRNSIHQFDIVHIHSLYLFPGIIAGHYARRYGVPYIVQPHGSLNSYILRRHRLRKEIVNRLFEYRNLRKAAGIHFATEPEMHQAHLPRGRQLRLILPLGVESHKFSRLPDPGGFKAGRPELTGKRLVVFLGRITEKKGLDLLIKAFARVRAAYDDVHLVVAGPDDEGLGPSLRQLATRLAVGGAISFVGMVDGESKRSLLADTDVWVLPSRDENFGIAVVEALACGIPTVVSDRVNIHGDIRGANAGLTVPCDPQAIGDAILAILNDRDLRVRLQASARQLVADRFSWDVAAPRVAQAYASEILLRTPR